MNTQSWPTRAPAVRSGNLTRITNRAAQYRGIEQVVARKPHKLQVMGSTPILPNVPDRAKF